MTWRFLIRFSGEAEDTEVQDESVIKEDTAR
jgi:hypothetical protein